jgi:hypothetical protein
MKRAGREDQPALLPKEKYGTWFNNFYGSNFRVRFALARPTVQ